MIHRTEEEAEGGMSIRIPVPASEASLYNVGGTDEILSFLSRNRYQRFTQRELAERVELPQSRVSRAVGVLEDNELVRAEYQGNRKLLEINRDRLSVPDDPYLRIPQSEFRKPVRSAVEELTTALEEVVAIVLYGSVATGEADRRSDVDLWILVSDDRAANQREANAVTDDLEDRRFGGERYAFHPVVESTESVPAFTDEIEEIVGSGITLYATPAYETFRELLSRENA